MEKRFVVSIETVKIKNFLYSTNKLKVIRGASYLLDYLNQKKVPEILKNHKLDMEKDVIYIGAGNAKFFTPNEEIAKAIENEIKELYALEAPGVHIACAHKETTYGTENKNEGKVWEHLDELGKNIAIEKNKGFPINNIDLPGIAKCELCGSNPAQVKSSNLAEDIKEITKNTLKVEELSLLKQQIENLAPKTQLICEECLKKINASNHIKLGSEAEDTKSEPIGFYEYLKKNNVEVENIKEIDEYGDENSFIGFMYSDGDGLGDFLKKVSEFYKNDENSEENYIEFLKIFSKTLDKVTKFSLLKAIKEVFGNNRKIKGEFLIVGGDDVCAVFDPHIVFEISRLFQTYFEINMEKEMKDKVKNFHGTMPRITSSCGIIIAKAKTPMYQLFNLALKLQKNAKKRRHEFNVTTGNIPGNETGFIDFQVIGSEGGVNINYFRKTLEEDGNILMARPYSIKELKNTDIKSLSHLIEVIEELKKNNFPKTKLRQIYDLKKSDDEEFEKKMKLIDMVSKMSEDNIKIIIRIFDLDINNYRDFNSLFNNIFDILEIYDFIGGAGNENQL